MNQPRSASAVGMDFPYTLETMCYFEVAEDGAVMWGNDRGSYERALAGKSRLYAVWPGQFSIDLWLDCGCEIRDLKAFASQMREQKGWDIATSRGWGQSRTEKGGCCYSMRVRRSSLAG